MYPRSTFQSRVMDEAINKLILVYYLTIRKLSSASPPFGPKGFARWQLVATLHVEVFNRTGPLKFTPQSSLQSFQTQNRLYLPEPLWSSGNRITRLAFRPNKKRIDDRASSWGPLFSSRIPSDIRCQRPIGNGSIAPA